MKNLTLLTLRRATIDDLDLLAEMYEELRFAEQVDNEMTSDEIRIQMCSFIEDTTYDLYLLVGENIIYGYGMLDITREPKYLRHLLIRQEYRKKGYGKRLTQLLMAQNEITTLDIDVFV